MMRLFFYEPRLTRSFGAHGKINTELFIKKQNNYGQNNF